MHKITAAGALMFAGIEGLRYGLNMNKSISKGSDLAPFFGQKEIAIDSALVTTAYCGRKAMDYALKHFIPGLKITGNENQFLYMACGIAFGCGFGYAAINKFKIDKATVVGCMIFGSLFAHLDSILTDAEAREVEQQELLSLPEVEGSTDISGL